MLATAREAGETNRAERILLLLITGDKGLCGGFNTNLIKAAREFLAKHQKDEVELAIVGRKGYDYFRRRSTKIVRQYLNVTATGFVSLEEAQKISEDVTEAFTGSEPAYDRVFLIYSFFKSALAESTHDRAVAAGWPDRFEW